MLSDHENLLSTFGKDSQSSNRKSKNIDYAVRSKRVSLNYDMEPKSRYQQILSQRKTLNMLEKLQQSEIKPKNFTKKMKTESDIECLNSRIRKSISGIAQTICKSKIKSNGSSKCAQFESSMPSRQKLSHLSKDSIQSYKCLKNYQSKKPRVSMSQKQNININTLINDFEQSKRHNRENLSKQEYLKNSTKKKGKFFAESNDCPIKSSFSIDMNSDIDSVFQSSRKKMLQKNCSKFNLTASNRNQESDRILEKFSKENLTKKGPIMNLCIGKEMQQTLKKQFKQLAESNYIEQPRFLQTRGNKGNRHSQTNQNQEFFFYDEDLNASERSPNFNNIEFSKTVNVAPVRKAFTLNYDQNNTKHHKLIEALMKQIQLDFDLRHAKHMFSGIEEPFYAHHNDTLSQSKWERLNQELNNLGLCYSVQTIKKIFLPCEEEIDPFLSVGKPHEELIYSLIYAYETAEIYWQQSIYQKWQHWDLRDIDLTIQSIDRDRKGYITVEDIAAFLSMQTGREFKNRDVVLIYKRLVNGFWSKHQEANEIFTSDKEKGKLKFRSLIDSLIKQF